MRIVSGSLRGRRIKTLSKPIPGYRPATFKIRQALFSMLTSRGIEWAGCRVLDLFAGSGSLGMECLSRGAEVVWFVENHPHLVKLLKENLSLFGIPQKKYRIIPKDVNIFLKKIASLKFHLCFIDPPYRKKKVVPVLKKLIRNQWMVRGGLVVAEVEEEHPPIGEIEGLSLVLNRTYGQTRILLWTVTIKN